MIKWRMIDSSRIRKSLSGIALGGIALSLSQVYYVQELFYTRKEAEAQDRRVDSITEKISRVDSKIDSLIAQGAANGAEIRSLREFLKKKSHDLEASLRSEEEAEYWRAKYEGLEDH